MSQLAFTADLIRTIARDLSSGTWTPTTAMWFQNLYTRVGASIALTNLELEVLISGGLGNESPVGLDALAPPLSLGGQGDLSLQSREVPRDDVFLADQGPAVQALQQDLGALAAGGALADGYGVHAQLLLRMEALEQALWSQDVLRLGMSSRLDDVDQRAMLGEGTPTPWSIRSLSGYVEGTFTITGTGFVANPTGTAKYLILGNTATVFLPTLTGTSNATTFTLTGLPAAITPVNGEFLTVPATDNSVAILATLLLTAGSTTITMSTAIGAGGAWTAANTKALLARTISYLLF